MQNATAQGCSTNDDWYVFGLYHVVCVFANWVASTRGIEESCVLSLCITITDVFPRPFDFFHQCCHHFRMGSREIFFLADVRIQIEEHGLRDIIFSQPFGTVAVAMERGKTNFHRPERIA